MLQKKTPVLQRENLVLQIMKIFNFGVILASLDPGWKAGIRDLLLSGTNPDSGSETLLQSSIQWLR
jgi:hypothetical protein